MPFARKGELGVGTESPGPASPGGSFFDGRQWILMD